ncbi:DUF2207 domain-containing protein [Tessaracoccus sp. HDW20]|uniref:DUF2207 domain-containing protein n=1 Tax=Tessaracoccus coleopterorum TaxID=2714950 RepID=UPI0018D49F82|nr:DUF2207 domain-containing protein [Tessaracoccus coleopterorum]NHB85525.1 DUF2207 domain-containing protein [Tessaracoccus coleopterorum]
MLETRDRDTVELRIGSPTVELAEGAQEFRIGYRLEDIALNTPEGQEVYLDVNGTGWGSPFGRVTARLQVPGSLAGRLTGANACYQGPRVRRRAARL